MASSTSIFDNYVKEAKTLSSMKSFFSAFEGIGIGNKLKSKDFKGLIDNIASFYNDNLSDIDSLDDVLNKFGITEDINSFKNLLQNQYNGLVSKVGNKLGPAYKSFLSAMNMNDADVKNLLLMLKPFIFNEEIFLKAIKKIYYKLDERPDVNFNNNLLNICLSQDFPLILEWLDSINNTYYDIREKDVLNRADFAAKAGSFHVVHYMLKKFTNSYKEYNTIPATSQKEKDFIDNGKLEYEEWAISTFKKTITNSLNNFTVSDYRTFLDDDIIPISVSSYGTSDENHHKKFLITDKDLDTFVPIYKSKINDKSKTYVLPKNKNMKKIYVAMSNETNDKMDNQKFHDRLDFKTFSPKEKAFNDVNEIFGGKPESIIKYAKDILFQINNVRGIIRDNEAIISPIMSAVGMNYDDFEFIVKGEDLTLEGISKKITELSIEKGKPLYYNETSVIKNELVTTTDPETGDTITEIKEVEEKYIVITDKEIPADTPEQKQEILNSALAKNLIDKETEKAKNENKPLTTEDLAAMYPSLTSEFERLDKYTTGCMEPTVPSIEEINVEDLEYFTAIQNPDGSVSSIEDVGIVKTMPTGETKIIGNSIPGIALGISSSNNNTVVLAKNEYNEAEIWVENPETGSYDKATIDPDVTKEISIVDGLGISSASNIIYYNAAYYNDKLYTIEFKNELNRSILSVYDNINSDSPNKIAEIDIVNKLELQNKYNEIKGISFLANGKIYAVITDYGVVEISLNEKYIITSAYKISDYTDNLMYNTKNVGTILNSVDININELYDFDIDDPKIIKSILNYYNKNRELIYHFSIKNGVIDIKRERDDWKSKEPYDKYSDEKDNSYRIENDYHGMSEEIEHTVYYGTEDIFNKYNEIMSDPTKTEDDNPGFTKDEDTNV